MIAQTFLSGCSLSLGVGVTVAFADVPVDGACLLTLSRGRIHTAHPHGLDILHVLPARRWSVLDSFQFPLNGSHRPCKSRRILAVLHLAHQGRTLLRIRLGLSGNYVGHPRLMGMSLRGFPVPPDRSAGSTPLRAKIWVYSAFCIAKSAIMPLMPLAPLGLVACPR